MDIWVQLGNFESADKCIFMDCFVWDHFNLVGGVCKRHLLALMCTYPYPAWDEIGEIKETMFLMYIFLFCYVIIESSFLFVYTLYIKGILKCKWDLSCEWLDWDWLVYVVHMVVMVTR